MKVLVTGANGYIGQGVVSQLIQDGHQVIATDLNCNHLNYPCKKVECDIFSLSDPYNYFGQPEVTLHLAWRNGFVHNSTSHLEDLPKHVNLLKEFIDAGIKRIAVMGTMHEIGFFEGSINENTPTRPQSFYGIAKNSLRNALEFLTKDSSTSLQWIRGYYIVGNSEYGNSIFSKITSAENKGQILFPFTLGQNQYDFIDYKDFCNQIAKIIEQSEITGIINACSGYPEKLADRVERFIRENKYHIQLNYGAFPDRPYDSKAVWGDNSKIKEIFKNHERIQHKHF